MPAASAGRELPRRNSSAQVTPLPHSGCACWIVPSTRNVVATGLRQPTTTRSFGDGWTATPCGFMLPGTRTRWSEELAMTLNESSRRPNL